MKERIFECIKSGTYGTSVRDINFYVNELSYYKIHKICEQLISDGLVWKRKVSGTLFYYLKDGNNAGS